MNDGLIFLLESRGAAALIYGLAVGALLRLLGLARNRGAAAGALAVSAAFVPLGWPGAHLVALVLGLAGFAGRLARPGESHRPGWIDIASTTLVWTLCGWVAALRPLTGLWLAAACAALGAGAAGWLARTVPGSAGGPRYRLPALRPVSGGDGIGAAALVAAAVSPGAVGAIAHGLGLVGPGEAAPLALGGLLSLALLGGTAGPTRTVAATLAAAGAGAALTAFLT